MTQSEKLKKRIPYDQDIFGNVENYNQIINDLLEDSRNMCLSILYPYVEDYSSITFPTKYNNWQIRACIELYNLSDKMGITNYTENGISFSRLSDGLSVSLMNELTPKVGIPKGSVSSDV